MGTKKRVITLRKVQPLSQITVPKLKMSTRPLVALVVAHSHEADGSGEDRAEMDRHEQQVRPRTLPNARREEGVHGRQNWDAHKSVWQLANLSVLGEN